MSNENRTYPRLLEDPDREGQERQDWSYDDPRILDHPGQRGRDGEYGRDMTATRIANAYRHAAEECGSYGDTVLWSPSRGLHVTRQDLLRYIREAAVAAALTQVQHEQLTNTMPKPLTARVAVPRALERFAQRQRVQEYGTLLVRRIKDTGDYGAYALVQEQTLDYNEDLAYSTVCKMTWSPERGDDPQGPSEIAVLAHPDWRGNPGDLYELADYYLTYHTPGDVSEMLVRMVEQADAVSLRANGGVYFVPAANAAMLDAINHLISLLQGHCGRFQVPRVETNTDFLVFAVGERLQADLRELERDVAEREATAKRAKEDTTGKLKGVAQATVDAYLARAAELRIKAERYMDLLDFSSTGVRSGITAVESRLQALEGRAESPFAGLEE